MQVALNLEETGLLYHLLMRHFIDNKIDPMRPVTGQLKSTGSALLTIEAVEAMLERDRQLMLKLGRANDLLMGKGAI